MKKWVKILILGMGICVLILVSITYGLIPIPLVAVFHPQSHWPIGFLTCDQLEQRSWYRCQTSGEFNGCEPYKGVNLPLIYELTFSKNCPDFSPPTYCGDC